MNGHITKLIKKTVISSPNIPQHQRYSHYKELRTLWKSTPSNKRFKLRKLMQLTIKLNKERLIKYKVGQEEKANAI